MTLAVQVLSMIATTYVTWLITVAVIVMRSGAVFVAIAAVGMRVVAIAVTKIVAEILVIAFGFLMPLIFMARLVTVLMTALVAIIATVLMTVLMTALVAVKTTVLMTVLLTALVAVIVTVLVSIKTPFFLFIASEGGNCSNAKSSYKCGQNYGVFHKSILGGFKSLILYNAWPTVWLTRAGSFFNEFGVSEPWGKLAAQRAASASSACSSGSWRILLINGTNTKHINGVKITAIATKV